MENERKNATADSREPHLDCEHHPSRWNSGYLGAERWFGFHLERQQHLLLWIEYRNIGFKRVLGLRKYRDRGYARDSQFRYEQDAC